MCFSSNPQTLYRRAWTKCPGLNATILRAGRDRGTLPSRELGAAAFPRHQLIRRRGFSPVQRGQKTRGCPHTAGQKPEFSPTAAGEGGLRPLPRDPQSLSLPTPLLAGMARQAGCFQPWGAQGLIASASRTGTDLRSTS